jgi:hypothetical protein
VTVVGLGVSPLRVSRYCGCSSLERPFIARKRRHVEMNKVIGRKLGFLFNRITGEKG